MKLLLLLASVCLFGVVYSDPGINTRTPQRPIYINRPVHKPSHRYRRSPEPQGSIVFQAEKPLDGPERRPTWNLDYQHKIYEGRDGFISATGGAQKLPGQHVEPHVGIQGTLRFRRSPEPQGSVVYQGRNGHVTASGGSRQPGGHRFQPHVGVQGRWRFRRSPEPQGSVVFEHQIPLSGHDRRPTTTLDYQHKIYEGRDGHISASGGAIQLPGHRFQPHVGIQGTWRFRRSPEPQGSVAFEHKIPLSGHDRRPTTTLGYKHNIYEGRNGQVSASGGAIQLPGHRFQPHIGIQGNWRFRRSPEPQGSVVFEHQIPLSGHDRRPTTTLDYQHKIYEGRDGHISASGGAIQLPGHRFQPHVGIQGTWRFRRSPEPQRSVVFQHQRPLSGHDRRPTNTLEYQHKIYEGRNGHVSASGGAIQLPGHHFQPHVGVQGTWRF